MSAPDSRAWVLGTETQRQFIGSLIATTPAGWVVRLEPPRRSLPQNSLLHALLTEAVDGGLATDTGRRLTIGEAKTAFVTAWMIEEGRGSDIIAFGGQPIQLRRSTTTLTKDEFSSLIEFIRASCAQRGIDLREAGEKASFWCHQSW